MARVKRIVIRGVRDQFYVVDTSQTVPLDVPGCEPTMIPKPVEGPYKETTARAIAKARNAEERTNKYSMFPLGRGVWKLHQLGIRRASQLKRIGKPPETVVWQVVATEPEERHLPFMKPFGDPPKYYYLCPDPNAMIHYLSIIPSGTKIWKHFVRMITGIWEERWLRAKKIPVRKKMGWIPDIHYVTIRGKRRKVSLFYPAGKTWLFWRDKTGNFANFRIGILRKYLRKKILSESSKRYGIFHSPDVAKFVGILHGLIMLKPGEKGPKRRIDPILDRLSLDQLKSIKQSLVKKISKLMKERLIPQGWEALDIQSELEEISGQIPGEFGDEVLEEMPPEEKKIYRKIQMVNEAIQRKEAPKTGHLKTVKITEPLERAVNLLSLAWRDFDPEEGVQRFRELAHKFLARFGIEPSKSKMDSVIETLETDGPLGYGRVLFEKPKRKGLEEFEPIEEFSVPSD